MRRTIRSSDLFLRGSWAILVALLAATTVAGAAEAPPSAADGPIAELAIRVLDQVRVGRRIRLRPPEGYADRYQITWELLRSPRASHGALVTKAGGLVSLYLDVPGTYVVRVSGIFRGDRRSVTLTVPVNEGPLVPVNTIDLSQGAPATVVGSQRYEDPGSGTGLHVVILDKHTLELAAGGNQSYPLTDAALSNLAAYLGTLADDKLVMVSLAPSAGQASISSVNAVLAKIGGVLPSTWYMVDNGCWSSDTQNCYGATSWSPGTSTGTTGSFSVIGIPKLSPGQAWFDSAAQRVTQNGALSGYLVAGTDWDNLTQDIYSFVFGGDQYTLADTCASGAPDACVMKIGDQTFEPDPGVNGMHVAILNRITLRPILHKTVTSTAALVQTMSFANVGHGLAGLINDNVLVMMQSVGNHVLPYVGANVNVLARIDQLGGTPETFAPATTQGKPYALIGVANKIPWHGTGTESSPQIDISQPGRSRVALTRDRMARFTPGIGDPTGLANQGLFPILYQPETPWPYAGSCAIPYLADKLEMGALYPDIRSAYRYRSQLFYPQEPLNVAYPSSPPSGCSPFPSEDEFTVVKTRISDEFKWVNYVRNFIDNVKQVYTDDQASPSKILDEVTAVIAKSVTPPPQSNTIFNIVKTLTTLTPIAGKVNKSLGSMVGLLAAVGKVGQETFMAPYTGPFGSGAALEALHSRADELGDQLDQEYLAHIEALGRTEVLLVTDAGKLQSIYTAIRTDAAWQWDATTESKMLGILNQATRAQCYSALLPPTWPMYNLKPDLKSQFASDSGFAFGCAYDRYINHPFAQFDAGNEFSSRHTMIAGNETSTNEIWTLALVPSDFNSYPRATLAHPVLTDELFSNAADGGAAYPPAWFRESYNPPGHVICGTAENSTAIVKPPPTFGPKEAGYTWY